MSDRNNIPEQPAKTNNGNEIPLAYAEESKLFEGVYALPLADNTTPGSLVRLTVDQEVKLQDMGFPLGLAQMLVTGVSNCPVRFWVVDNSGSMWENDGKCLRGKGKNTQLIPCTRWAEMQSTVDEHAELAGLLEATTVFHMLNHPGDPRVPQEFSIAEHGAQDIRCNIDLARQAMLACQPQGPTPLAERLMDIREKIAAISPMLRSDGQTAVVVLATDGLPTDAYGGSSAEASRDFVQVLRSLQDYPVWLVVRLCTDDEETCAFYNSLDSELELPLEVLDDFVAEAKEVGRFNGWLNYGLSIHRSRELGYQHRIFDLLDERALNKDEVKEFLELLFGKAVFFGSPDVHQDWRGFLKALAKIVKIHKTQWNPRTQKMEPWIDVKKLDKVFSERLSLFARMGSSARRDSKRGFLKHP